MKVAPAYYHNHDHDILKVFTFLVPFYKRVANRLKTEDFREIRHYTKISVFQGTINITHDILENGLFGRSSSRK